MKKAFEIACKSSTARYKHLPTGTSKCGKKRTKWSPANPCDVLAGCSPEEPDNLPILELPPIAAQLSQYSSRSKLQSALPTQVNQQSTIATQNLEIYLRVLSECKQYKKLQPKSIYVNLLRSYSTPLLDAQLSLDFRQYNTFLRTSSNP